MKRHLLALVTLLSASLLAAQPSDPLEGLPNYYRLRPDIATAERVRIHMISRGTLGTGDDHVIVVPFTRSKERPL